MKYIKEEIVNAVNYYNLHNESVTDVAFKFLIDRHTLSKFLKTDITEAVYVPDRKIYVLFAKDEKDAIEKYQKREYPSVFYAAKQLGIHHDKFVKMCKYAGIEVHNALYSHSFNRNAFEKIKTEEDAYILGYITADGYICESRNELRFKTKIEDENVLRKINAYLESDYEIRYEYHNITGNKLAKLSFCDKGLIKVLNSYGLYQAKSGKETFCKDIPLDLMRHYIRGLFDGDGFITKKDRVIGLCGSYDVLFNTREFLINALNLDVGNKYQIRYAEDQHVHKMAFCGDAAETIIKFLYQNSNIYIDRKYDLAKRFFD